MTVTNYLWDQNSYLEEYDQLGTATAAYTNEPITDGSLISQSRDGDTSYCHADGIGSVNQLTNEMEVVTDSYVYDAWGTVLSHIGTTIYPFQFVGLFGYYFDSETEQFYIRSRVYQPHTSRWISEDPALFIDGMNLYKYVKNRPLNAIDPSGRVTQKVCTYFSTKKCDRDFRICATKIISYEETGVKTHEYSPVGDVTKTINQIKVNQIKCVFIKECDFIYHCHPCCFPSKKTTINCGKYTDLIRTYSLLKLHSNEQLLGQVIEKPDGSREIKWADNSVIDAKKACTVTLKSRTREGSRTRDVTTTGPRPTTSCKCPPKKKEDCPEYED